MKFLNKFRSIFFKRKLEAEMAEEMRHHLEMQEEANRAAGMSPDEARYAAQRQFGHMDGLKEQVREARGWLWLEQILQDLRYAIRGLTQARGFTAVAVLTLTLGIGVTTTLFSVVYGVLLDPYPYAKSNEIWVPKIADLKTGRGSELRICDYLEIAKLLGVAQVMATNSSSAMLSGGENPEIIRAIRVSDSAFDFLGVPPVLGRGLTRADIKSNGDAEPVCVLSFKLWQRLFNSDLQVLGRTLVIDDVPHTVIGVMPPRFGWYTNESLWLPLPMTDLQRPADPILRLNPGISRKTVEQQFHALYLRLAKETPDRFPKDGFTSTLQNYLEITSVSGEMRSSLHLLVYAVGFLLLIACTNVANLQLARGAVRSREIAIRLSIGASRARVFRQLLTESVVLSLTGGLMGILVAFGLIQLIVALMPPFFFVTNEARITINGTVLAFSTGISVITGIKAGLAPGLLCTRFNLNTTLKDGGHGAGAGAGVRTRKTLVVIQIGLSVVLLVGASLAIRGFMQLHRLDPGFRTERLLLLRLPLSEKRYATLGQRNAFAQEFIDRIQNLPGVVSVAAGTFPYGDLRSGYSISGQPKPEGHDIAVNPVSADYCHTLGISLRAGRDLTPQEIARGDPVALINEAATKLWPAGESPIGRSIQIDALTATDSRGRGVREAKEITVVGIFNNTRNYTWMDARGEPPPAILVPHTLRSASQVTFLVRTQGDPQNLLNRLRAEVRAIDKEVPIYRPMMVKDIFGQQIVGPRFNMMLFGGLAAIALLLAAAGIYSVLAFHVAQRTREIGVRMALGADRDAILRLVIGAGSRLLGAGLVIGLVASLALTRIVKSQVFIVPVFDPLALIAATLLLSAAAMLACIIPARRAAKVDPMVALRTE